MSGWWTEAGGGTGVGAASKGVCTLPAQLEATVGGGILCANCARHEKAVVFGRENGTAGLGRTTTGSNSSVLVPVPLTS